MDIDMEMNGHSANTHPPTDPDSTSLSASNMAASLSNAETVIPSLPPKPLVTVPPSDTAEPADAPSPTHHSSLSFTEPTSQLPPLENGTSQASPPPIFETPANGKSATAHVSEQISGFNEGQAPPQQENPLSSLPILEPQIDPASQQLSSMEETFSGPSVITETQPLSLAEPREPAAPPANDLGAILNQAPTSDLRTSPPPPGSLTSEAAMTIRSEKEHRDFASDPQIAESLGTSAPELNTQKLSPIPSPQPPPMTTASLEEPPIDEGVEMDTSFDAPPPVSGGLPSPPPQSPPPAPQPAHAVLPLQPPEAPSPQPMPAAIALEQPADPAPTPVLAPPAAEEKEDLPMPDVVSPPAKIAREREEDAEDAEPLAKRAKTEGEEGGADFKIPNIPGNVQTSVLNGRSPSASCTDEPDEDDTVTQPRLVHMKKIISNLKKGTASTHFRLPVDPIALNIPQYYDIIKTPMDLSKIDAKLKNQEYRSVKDFITDFRLIVENSATFNGAEHAVTQAAYKMQNSFDNQIQHMPKAGVPEASREEKRAQKAKVEPTRTAPPRRPSVTTITAPTGGARSPSSASATQTFAVGPEGVPLIRRDSNIVDGRPKRAIVPPKRNNEFGGGRPKKKKYELQLKFCQEAMKEIYNSKNWTFAQYFLNPVDPVALNIPTYFQVIKKPMDFGTIQQKLDSNAYEKARDFEEDCRLVFKNCYKFNAEGEWVNQCGHKLEEAFDKKWATKDDWIASREPTSEPQSAGDEEDEEEEDSEEEEEEEESEDERQQKIVELQKQIEAMSKKMGELANQPPKKKKKSKSPVPAKKSKSSKVKKEKTAGSAAPGAKKERKKSMSKPKAEKEKFVNISYADKQYISNGISQLPDKQMNEALKIIQQNVPHLRNTHETEIELDIEEVPNHVLAKLLTFVKKYAGPPPEETKAEASYSGSSAVAATSKPKKNKPMSKHEQEAQIEELKGKLGQYAGGGPVSPDAVQSIETGADSSDDEVDSEESEEE